MGETYDRDIRMRRQARDRKGDGLYSSPILSRRRFPAKPRSRSVRPAASPVSQPTRPVIHGKALITVKSVTRTDNGLTFAPDQSGKLLTRGSVMRNAGPYVGDHPKGRLPASTKWTLQVLRSPGTPIVQQEQWPECSGKNLLKPANSLSPRDGSERLPVAENFRRTS
jgi:hypothetical protein